MPLVAGAGYKLYDTINDSLADGAIISYSAGKSPVSFEAGLLVFIKYNFIFSKTIIYEGTLFPIYAANMGKDVLKKI